jgi:CubicO group peptidase (beta-lactamase class C family)
VIPAGRAALAAATALAAGAAGGAGVASRSLASAGAAPGPTAALPDDTVTALTLLRDREGLVPLPGGLRVLSLAVTTAADAPRFATFDAELGAGGLVVESALLAPDGTEPESLAAAIARAETVVVSADGEALTSGLLEILRRIQLTRPLVLVAFRPALIGSAGSLGTYLVLPGREPAHQRAAARGLVGTEPISGTLAADLPPHRAGDGLRREGPAGAVRAPRSARTLPMSASFAEVDPASAAMDGTVLQRLDQLIRDALADSAAPGAALAIGRRGKLVRLRGYGTLDYADDRPVSPATIFDLASLTKVVATTPAAMILEAEGKLDLDAPVIRYLPWFARGDARKSAITVRQLLLHRSGFAPFRPWYRDRQGLDAYREAIGDEKLEFDPGARTLYSDINFLTLGLVIEAIAGMPLDRFVSERLLTPLGMEDTSFHPDARLLPRIAPTEVDTVFRHAHVRGVVHDENAYAMGGIAGHAGLFSTAWDLAVYADLMLSGGLLPACAPSTGSGVACTRERADSARVLAAESVERWTRRADAGGSYALGWDTPEGANSSAGSYLSPRAFGHTGFTGTSIWIDPELDLFVILLTNRVNPTRDNQRHVALRRAVADAAARAVLDREVVRSR